MKTKKLIFTWLGLTLTTLCSWRAQANSIAYVSGPYPWDLGPSTVMNAAFGAGNWDDLNFTYGAGVFSAGYDFIYIDGGDGADANFQSFINGNRTTMENWVSAGGSIFLNAARWNPSSLDLGFGATLVQGVSRTTYSTTGHAAGSHPIFDASTGTSWSGTWFSHDIVTGGGSAIILNENNNAILTEMSYGAGHVLLGGITDPYYHSPSPAAYALRENILTYGASQAGPGVPDAGSTFVLLGGGLIALAGVRRKLLKA